jgi:hypothetical protein
MEVCNQIGGFEVDFQKPQIFFESVSLLSYQILQLPIPHPAIDYLLNLIPFLSPYDLGWWQSACPSPFNWVRWGGHEFDDMEHRMEVQHRLAVSVDMRVN